MSTITDKQRNVSTIKFFRTRVKLYVHSHQTASLSSVKNPIIIDQDIISFNTSKAVKGGAGSCTIVLLPRYNYLNVIYPNDYVNLYVDRGDGEGWTRVFFGFVDRISEDSKVESSGESQTVISLSCTDFTKIFEKTQIYFNPQVAQRDEFKGDFIGALNIGGVALRSRGVTATGSPPDMILNFLFILLGAGGQFVLPPGYSSRTKDRFRQQRAEFALQRLERDLKSAQLDGGSEILKALAERERAITEDNLDSTVGKGLDLESTQPSSLIERAKAIATEVLTNDALKGINKDFRTEISSVFQSADSSTPLSFLDILDVFTFVERESIDGYVDGVTVWQKSGSLMSFIKSHSNESVNELFFDLRPMTQDSSSGLARAEWDRTEDEIGGNLDDGSTGADGIRFVPALVMREYPFSTIDSVDGSNITLNLKPKDERKPQTIGNVQFGSIFNDSPDVPGRHIIQVPNINVEDQNSGRAESLKAKKHLDVAVIQSQDVISYSWGRSDSDHFNLFELYSDSVLGTDAKFFLQDLLPIITPIHIARHGLRVRSVSTRFARFNTSIKTRKTPTEPVEEKSEGPAELARTNQVLLPQGTTPISKKSVWGKYRFKSTEGKYFFHHGVDLYIPEGSPIQAVADGEVVAVAPNGVFSGYGNTVIIKHTDPYKGKTVFSVYNHLQSIDSSIVSKTNKNLSFKRANCMNSKLSSLGRMPSAPVQAGTIIGLSGQTAGTTTNRNAVFSESAPHLHFEIITSYPAKQTPVGVPPPIDNLSEASIPSNIASFDPEQFFADEGSPGHTDLFGGVAEEVTVADNDDKDDEATDGTSPPRPDGGTKHTEPITTPAAAEKHNNVDSSTTRNQLIRWALLNDHWYQHNLEYLAGTIKMHGAPEIRVGYRLDFKDKRLSFYIEGVQHSWSFPGKMETTLQVTRGQPNNPFPLYVLPAVKGFTTKENQRKLGSRLGEFCVLPDSLSTLRSVSLGRTDKSTDLRETRTLDDDGNTVDLVETDWYDEDIIPAGGTGQIELDTTEAATIAEELSVEFEELDRALSALTTGAVERPKEDT